MITKRGAIAEALKEALKTISQANGYNTNLYSNVQKRFIFPDEDPEIPIITLSAGPERIDYLPGGAQDRYLTLSIRAYIEDQNDSIKATEDIIKDIETVVEKNSRLVLQDGSMTRDIRISLINTDQGVLSPLGVAEIELIVEY